STVEHFLLFIRFGHYLRYLAGLAMRVEGDESEISLVCKVLILCRQVFSPYPEEDFHRCIEGPGQFGFYCQQVAQLYGAVEGNIIYRGGNHGTVAVFLRGYSSCYIHPVQELAPHEVSESIGIVG